MPSVVEMMYWRGNWYKWMWQSYPPCLNVPSPKGKFLWELKAYKGICAGEDGNLNLLLSSMCAILI